MKMMMISNGAHANVHGITHGAHRLAAAVEQHCRPLRDSCRVELIGGMASITDCI